MLIANLPALQVITPLVAAPLCALISYRRFAWILTTMTTTAAFLISLYLLFTVHIEGPVSYAMGGWKAPVGIEYRVDFLSAFFLVLVSMVAAGTSLFASKSIENDVPKEKQSLFYATFLLCFAGLLGIIITNDAFNIYVFLEISSLAAYALIAMGKERRALTAAFEYLILGSIGATFILIAVGLLYMITGTLNITDMSVRLVAYTDSPVLEAALAFLTIGLALKIAVFPLHIWLTNAYSYAPSFVSAFLSATATKVSIYVLIRAFFFLFGYKLTFIVLPLDNLLVILGVTAVITGALIAVFQKNVKRLLAYSSVSQIGYIILAIGLTSKMGVVAALVNIFNHSLAKVALFMAAGCVVYQVGGASMERFNGLARRMPYTGAAFIVAALSLIGFPGTAGFISKWYLLKAIYEQGLWPVFALVVMSSLLAVIYMWRVIEAMYFKEPNRDDSRLKEAPLSMLVPLWMFVFLSVILGWYTYPTVGIAEQVADYITNFYNPNL